MFVGTYYVSLTSIVENTYSGTTKTTGAFTSQVNATVL